MAKASSASSSGPNRPLLAVLDFDGTITTEDCLEVVFRRHLPTEGSHVSEGSRPEMTPLTEVQRAVAALRLSPAQAIAEFVSAAILVRGFAAFLDALLTGGGRVVVISLGFREGIERVWRREGLPEVALSASELASTGLALSLVPNRCFGSCKRCGPGGCKGKLVRDLRRPGELVAAFGNGKADRCLADDADVVFARGHLARLCDEQGMKYCAFEDYEVAWHELRRWWTAASRPATYSPTHSDHEHLGTRDPS